MAIRIRRGTTRTVLVLGGMAFKIARNRAGIRSNRYEATIWKLNQGDSVRGARLCPVLWSPRGGILLVMVAAAPLPLGVTPTSEWGDFWDYDPSKGEIDGWPGEFKREDWGVIDGRCVLVDYAAPVVRELA